MRLAGLVNAYINDQAPWKTLESDRERAATVLYVCLRCVDSLKTLFLPFLPFSSQRVHELLGHGGHIAGPLEFRDEHEHDGSVHTVLTGDYASWVGSWEPSALVPGQKLLEPVPLYRKLDPRVVEDELRRMDPDADAA
jgi:methionyl-tRNA synthetase